MSLKERINSEIKVAMKAGDKVRTSVLRMLLSEIKYAQAATDARSDLADEETLKVITTYNKRLRKSLGDYPEGEKQDAIKAEIAIVETFLPKKATREEVASVVDGVLARTDQRAFGPLMKEVLAALGAAADGSVVSQVLKEKLG